MSSKIQNAVIAITGAGSGIGRALAIQAGKEGARVALSDIKEADLQETKHLCEAAGATVLATVLDVSKQDQVTAWANEVHEHFGKVNVIINNAGVALSASVEEMSNEDFEWLMGINFWGVIYGCQAFLPFIKQADWGHIVNVSSLFGLISIPNQSAYNSAKFAVRGFTESLRMELEIAGYPIGVSCVHPGGIKTNIANNGRYGKQVGKSFSAEKQKEFFNKSLARTSPESAANDILNGIKNNRPRVLVGNDAKVLDALQRVLPARYQKLVMRVTQ